MRVIPWMSFLIHLHLVGGDFVTSVCLSDAQNHSTGDCSEHLNRWLLRTLTCTLFCLCTISEIPIPAQVLAHKPVTIVDMAERELTMSNVCRNLKKKNHRGKTHCGLLNAKKTPLTQGLNTSGGWQNTIYCYPGLMFFPNQLLQSTAIGNILHDLGLDPVGPFSISYYIKPRNLLKPMKHLSWKTWHAVLAYFALQEHLKL